MTRGISPRILLGMNSAAPEMVFARVEIEGRTGHDLPLPESAMLDEEAFTLGRLALGHVAPAPTHCA